MKAIRLNVRKGAGNYLKILNINRGLIEQSFYIKQKIRAAPKGSLCCAIKIHFNSFTRNEMEVI